MDLQNVILLLSQLVNLLWPLGHPRDVVLALLDNSVGLLLKVWFGFILSTTDFETGGDFIKNVTKRRRALLTTSGLALEKKSLHV